MEIYAYTVRNDLPLKVLNFYMLLLSYSKKKVFLEYRT